MITTLASPKPGSGTSTTAALLALAVSADARTHLVDLCGDQSALFNIDNRADSVDITEGLRVRNLRDAGLDYQADTIGRLARATDEHVIVDVGDASHPIHDRLPVDVIRRWVIRRCYLALRRATECQTRPDEVILLEELGRVLRISDVEAVTAAPVGATIEVHPHTARLIDAGLLTGQPPRAALTQLAGLVKRTKAVRR